MRKKCPLKHDLEFKKQMKHARQLEKARSQQQASYSHNIQLLKAASSPGIKPAGAGKKEFAPSAPITQLSATEGINALIVDLVHSPSSKPVQKTVNKSNRRPVKKN